MTESKAREKSTIDQREDNFWEIVQQEAKKRGCVFFIESVSGKDFEFGDFQCDEIFGWLIPQSMENEFKPLWEKDEADEAQEWDPFFVLEKWKIEGDSVLIDFEKFEEWGIRWEE